MDNSKQGEDQQSPQESMPSSIKIAQVGLNLDSTNQQVGQGFLTYAMNAQTENFDGNQITYQNEQANQLCCTIPEGYMVNGVRNIIEDSIIILWLLNPDTGDCEIGKVVDCIYTPLINSKCLGFSIIHPIQKTVHRRRGCDTEVYWVNGLNRMRYINLNKLPFKTEGENCNVSTLTEVDCNKLNLQPNFSIPELDISAIDNEGNLIAGTYQFTVQYCNALGEPYTPYYSVTNPVSIADPLKVTADFNYNVSKAINISISNIDVTGYYDYINLAVVKTINNITSVELVGTFQVTASTRHIVYTGQSQSDIKLAVADIFQKYEIYDTAADMTNIQDVLIFDQLTTAARLSYQEIANNISLKWQSWRLPSGAYKDPANSANLRGYMRDEIYPYEAVFLLTNGKQTDGFHIPGRRAIADDLSIISNTDVVQPELPECDTSFTPLPKWKVYNTASVSSTVQFTDPCYTGPYQSGEFAFWESTELYPCNPIYGELANTPIRHHKFPDHLVSPHHDDQGYIYPIGVEIDIEQVVFLINNSQLSQEEKSQIQGIKIVRGNRANNKSVVARGLMNNVGEYTRNSNTFFYPNYPYNDLRPDPFISPVAIGPDSNNIPALAGFATDESRKRFTFHSPDTSFYQPTLGDIVKVETIEYGTSRGHFQQVQNHAMYKFLSTEAYILSLGIAGAIAVTSIGGLFTGNSPVGQAVDAYLVLVDLIYNIIPRRNFAYQYNSIGDYNKSVPVLNNGNKIRTTDIEAYINPGMITAGDTHPINNFQRESSVYLRTTSTLPFPQAYGAPEDESRFVASEPGLCDSVETVVERPVSSYYSSIKRDFVNQYGTLYSYETIDTGYQKMIDVSGATHYGKETFFGGDTFINRFGYKSKLPFFIDNRVNFPNDADVFYDELSNVGYTSYWMSTDVSSLGSGGLFRAIEKIIGIKVNNFDCDDTRSKFLYQDGKFYLFAYGIPYFYCESEVNVDLRQAYNATEGDFYPHVSSDIPDYWLQEIVTSIKNDNTYTYNTTFSKQNKEDFFSHLPDDYDFSLCRRVFPFRAIFSEEQKDSVNPSARNNWLIFKPAAYFDFPQNFGSLISLEGMMEKQVLARFETKSMLYNALLTAPTSAAEVYLGQSLFNDNVPPLEFDDTDLGYGGTQHKMFIKTEFGAVSVDSKRGQVFVIPKRASAYYKPAMVDITKGVSKFMTEFLDFDIKKSFPNINTDNNFGGIGLHGVYDNKYNRLILTKLDYQCLDSSITYDPATHTFKKGISKVELSNPTYFCNKSFTISYDFDNQSWISFHSYLPEYYIGEANFFYSGINSTPSIWSHNTIFTKFNNFYNKVSPYIIEYPYAYTSGKDEIIQSIQDYTKVLQYMNFEDLIETDDVYFDNVVLHSNQQCSGVLKLTKKPFNNLQAYNNFPKYFPDMKEVLFTKSDSMYKVNTFWNMVKDVKQPVWKKSCLNLSVYKELNQLNLDYNKRSFKKAPIRGRDLKVRYTLSSRDDVKMLSQFIVTGTQISYK